jgi:hypothetical protein
MAQVQFADLITGYPTQLDYFLNVTTERLDLLESGAISLEPFFQKGFTGVGSSVELPFYNDLSYSAPLKPNEAAITPFVSGGASALVPGKITTAVQIVPRCYGVYSFSAMNFVQSRNVGHDDPLQVISSGLARLWNRHYMRVMLNILKGIFADNDAAPSGSEHVAGDMTFDASVVNGNTFTDGFSNFTSENFNQAASTMGERADDLRVLFVHSRVYTRLRNMNLVDSIPDANNPLGYRVTQMFQGNISVVVSDQLPVGAGNVYTSYLLGNDSFAFLQGYMDEALDGSSGQAVVKDETAGNGYGQSILLDRRKYFMHPRGFSYVPSIPSGGPAEGTSSTNWGHVDSFKRVVAERQQVKIARLITREA